MSDGLYMDGNEKTELGFQESVLLLWSAKIVDDLLNYANEKYGLDFDESDTPKAVYVGT